MLIWTLTAEGLLTFLAGGSNEKAVPGVPPVLMLLHELRKMAALPRAMLARRRSGLFIKWMVLGITGLFTILLRVQLRNFAVWLSLDIQDLLGKLCVVFK